MLAGDGRRYTWEAFATYYRRHADAMWKRAWGREMAIWSRVVARLEENLRRIRWRIIARKMNRFAGVCLIHAYRRSNPRLNTILPLFDYAWPADRTPPPLPWHDYEDEPWDVTDMPGIGSELPLAQPDPAEPDLAQPDRSEDAQRQARQKAGG